LFTAIEDIEKVTAEDVQRVAKEYFRPGNRTIAVTYQPAVETAPAVTPGGGAK
jgi:predicted Zn-dependent peptidase